MPTYWRNAAVTRNSFIRHGVVAGGFCLCFFLGLAIAAFGAGPAHADATQTRVASADLACAPSARVPPCRCICTKDYRPVCGRTPEGAQFTYANPCMAGCAGAIVIRPGRC